VHFSGLFFRKNVIPYDFDKKLGQLMMKFEPSFICPF